MKGCIIYFSGTGNTEYVARAIKQELQIAIYSVTPTRFLKIQVLKTNMIFTFLELPFMLKCFHRFIQNGLKNI